MQTSSVQLNPSSTVTPASSDTVDGVSLASSVGVPIGPSLSVRPSVVPIGPSASMRLSVVPMLTSLPVSVPVSRAVSVPLPESLPAIVSLAVADAES